MYRNFFKRLIDFIVSLIGVIVLSPFLILTTIILWINNKSSAFFFQERPGLHTKAFNVIKFKTMTDEKDASGKLLPDVERITKIGLFIRKYSIDELPQLFNVLIGDMSLIGPRPLLFKYVPLYSKEQSRRHEARPGITGLAQVSGRNSISWKEKFAFDVYYIDNLTFFLDVKILWMTLYKVIKREGVNQSDDRPMQPFNGNN